MPLPRALRGCSGLLMDKDLFCKLDIAFGALGAGVVGKDGFAETGGFGEADAAGDGGLEDLILEEFAEIGGDLAGEVGAVVVHGEENAFNFEGMLEGFADSLDGIDEFGDAFEGEEFALNGDDDGIGGEEGVEGEEVECGGAIDEDELVIVAEFGDAVAEAVFAAFDIDEFEVGAD